MEIEFKSQIPSEINIGDRIDLTYSITGISKEELNQLQIEVPKSEDLTQIRFFENKKEILEDRVIYHQEFTYYSAGEKQIPPIKFFINGKNEEGRYTDPLKVNVKSSHDGSQNFQQPLPMMEIPIPSAKSNYLVVGGISLAILLLIGFLLLRIFRKKKKPAKQEFVERKYLTHFAKIQDPNISPKDFAVHGSLALRHFWEDKTSLKLSAMTYDEIIEVTRNSPVSLNLSLLNELEGLKYTTKEVRREELSRFRDAIKRELQ